MPHTRGKEIQELFEAMAYNEVSSISVDQAIADLVNRHDICQDKSVSTDDAQELAKRLHEIADMVEKDRSALTDIFAKRVPIAIETPAMDIDLLISFARYYAALIQQGKMWRNVNIDGGAWPENAIFSIYSALFTIIQNSHLRLYMKHISFGPRVVLGGQSSIDTAMIVMADADLYAVVRSLTAERVSKTDYLDRPLWYLKRIWVQEPAKEKLVQLIDELKTKDDTCSIQSKLHAFRNRDEVLRNLEKEVHVKAFSVWSSDVANAINMAHTADRVFLIWINSYGEIGPGVALPWTEVGHHNSARPADHEATLTRRVDGTKSVDLFYDGAWQEPTREGYWKDEKGILRASATWNDVDKCVASAQSGFKKWRSLTLSQRQRCFYRLANRIQSNGNSDLSRLIRVMAECPMLYGSSSARIQDGRVEIVTSREPRGIVAIVSFDSSELFRRLVCASIAGNSVIITSGLDNLGIEEYCNVFTTCGFPPGVLNFLTFYDLPNAIAGLSKNRSVAVICTDAADRETNETAKNGIGSHFWLDADSRDETSNEKLYAKYTRPKSVWLPLR